MNFLSSLLQVRGFPAAPIEWGKECLLDSGLQQLGRQGLERSKPTFKPCPDQGYDGIFELLPVCVGSVCFWVYGVGRG